MGATSDTCSSFGSALRFVVTAVVAAVFVLCWCAPAYGDVAVMPQSVDAGTTTDVMLSVSNDSTTSDITEIVIRFTGAGAVPDVNPPRHNGWSVAVNSDDNGVSDVTWSSGKLAPGAQDIFTLTMTAPRQGTQLYLDVTASLADGSTVHWAQPGVAGFDAVHEAPAIELAGGTPLPTTVAPSPPAKAPAKKKENGWLGEIIIGVGVVSLLLVYTRSKQKNKKDAAFDD